MESTQSNVVGTDTNGVAPRDTRLLELAHGALRRATQAVRAEGTVDAEVRLLIRGVCDVAHERGLVAEQLVVVLKDAWWELPEKRRLPRQDASAVLAHAITLCIHEFYAREDGIG